MKHSRLFVRKETWLMGVALLGYFGLAQAQSTDIANSPLVTSAAASAKPNIMFLLDDSDSMNRHLTPEQLYNYELYMCRANSTDTKCGISSGGQNALTKVAGPPFFAKEFNVQFYDPTVTYLPPVDYDGSNTTYKSYTNTTAPFLWSTVRRNQFPGGVTTTVDLTTAYPEEVLCNSTSATPTDAVRCRRNLMTNPTFSVTFGTFSSGTPKSLVVNLANNGCQLGDTVKFINVGSPSTYNSTVFSVTAASSSNFTITWTPGPITAPSGGTPAVTACNIPITRLSTVGTTATAVFPIPHGCVVGDSITIKGASGPVPGYNLTNPVISVPDERTLTYAVAAGPATIESSGGAGLQFIARSTLCAGTKSNYSLSTTVPPLMQGFPQGVFNKVLTLSGAPYGAPYYYTISPNEYCTSDALTICDSTIAKPTHPAPAVVRYCTTTPAEVSSFPGATIPATPSPKGCQRLFDDTTFNKTRYGYFSRVDIVPATASYPKTFTRLDCSGAVGPTGCSYAQEMTNFANFWSYYRARFLMAKTSAGLAFKTLDQSYRVGFNTINAPDNTRWLANAPFDNAALGQKNQWYDKLYSLAGISGTPSREALSRIGRYYGGLKTAAAAYITDDPVEYSCQQNLTVFVTDGYWTGGTGGVKLDGSTMDDQDGKPGILRPYLDTLSTSNKLSDVGLYYYATDLRTPSSNPTGALGLDVTENNVPPTVKDPNTAQHMTTFTMGMATPGQLVWKPGYDTAAAPSADYNAIVNSTACATGNPCIWPLPVAATASAADDLWHTAVNGRGTYFSAKNPNEMAAGLLNAFASLGQKTGTEAAAATSTPNIVPGDNFVFSSSFTTLDWFGETTRRQIDTSTGAILGIDWTAQAQLDSKVSALSDTRTIYTFDGGAANKVKNFLWANLTAAEQDFFNGTSGGRQKLAQWNFLNPLTQQAACDNPGGADCGQKLVNYLRGQRGNETTINSLVAPDSANSSLFRLRVHVLGDIVSAEAGYVRVPVFNYGDQGYSTFKANNLARQAALYLGANDGMLHALNATTGAEMWAYIPSMVMPNLWKLANFSYAANHLFFVDGTPTTGDICTSNCSIASATWATILVGGLNAGGRGFYALDITDPANPKALWELKSPANCTVSPGINVPSVSGVPQDPVPASTFSDCDIGLSFGTPIITKRADGKWVVLVTSGYNNISPGSGGGFLYVIDAVTGAILNKIATLIPNPPGFAPGLINAGNTTKPSGFTKINAFAAATNTDNTTLRVYGGDLNGNLWRIDSAGFPNTLATSGNQATLLAMLSPANGLSTQGNGTNSITTKPELGEIVASGVGTLEMVYVGTGRYLGVTDLGTTTQESFYGIRDPLGSFSGYGVIHTTSPIFTNLNFVQQTLTEAVNPVTLGTERFTTSKSVDYTSKKGWFIDFNPGNVSPGERNNTDSILTLGILSFTTNAPDTNLCNVGGKSYRYFLDYTTGGPLSTSVGGVSGALVAFAPSTRPIVVNVNGKLYQIINVQGTPQVFGLPPVPSSGGGKRIFWRELFN